MILCVICTNSVFYIPQVSVKRTNRPGLSTTNRGRGRGRGRGFRGGGYSPYGSGGYMMMPVPAMPYYRGGRGRGFRSVCGRGFI